MPEKQTTSPRWSSTVKLVVALTMVSAVIMVVVNFRTIIGPLLLSVVLAYLLVPIIQWLHTRLKLPWRLIVTILFLLVIATLLGLLTWGGITLVEQVQGLVGFLQNTIDDIPNLIAQFTSKPLVIGPFSYDLGHLDLSSFGNQVLGMVEPVLSRAGTLVGTLATSAVTTIGWVMFILLIAFFILSETGGESGRIINFQIPGYQEEIRRIGNELGRIWNAFLRGQISIVGIEIFAMFIILSFYGVRYAFWLALLAGLARFLPWIGPAIAWTIFGLVSYFQGSTVFGLLPISFAILVVGSCWLMDTITDNFISPRLMASALKVHPAAVLVAALIAASWLGIIGVILAAPVLASLKLFVNYSMYKFFDLDPWQYIHSEPLRQIPHPIVQLKSWWSKIRQWRVKK